MSDLRKAAEAALEALEGFVYHGIGPNSGPALASLRAALAQPVMANGLTEAETNASASVMGLTRPQPEQLVVGGDDLPTLTKWTPQRKPLTEVEIYKMFGWYAISFVRAVEAAHGIE